MASPATVLSSFAFVTLLQVCMVCCITGQTGEAMGSKLDFQVFRNLNSLRCNARDVIGAGGRAADLLDTDAKLDAFAATLTADQRTFFTQLRGNIRDFSFAPFTADEARRALLFLMNYLNAEGRASFLLVRTQFDTIPYGDVLNALQTWHPIILLLFTKETHCYLFGQLNETLLETYCSRFIEDGVSAATFLATVNRCPDCVGLGVERRQDDSMIGALSDAKCQAYMDKVRQYKQDGWDVFYLGWCPQETTIRDVGRIADNNYCNANQQLRLKESRFKTKLKPGVLRKIGEKLASCFGQLNTWSDQRITNFAAYVVHLPRKLLQEMTVSQFATNFDALVAVPNIGRAKFLRVLGYKVASWWAANSGTFSSERQIRIACAVIKYAPDKRLFKLLDRANLQTIINAFDSGVCSSFQLTPEEARVVVTQVLSDAGFTWDVQTLGYLGKYIGRLPGKIFKEIPQNVICPNWQSINTADIGRAQLAILWDKCKDSFSNPSSYTCDILKQTMGTMIRALPKSYVNQIPNAVLAGCTAEISVILEPVLKRRKGLRKLIWKKVKAYAIANSQNIGTFIAQARDSLASGVQDYSGVTLDSLGGIDNLNNLNLENRAAMNALWKKVKAALGAVTHANTQYCENFPKIYKIFVAAASERDWENLCEDENVIQNIARAASMLDKLNGRKIRAVIKKLLRLFGVSGDVKKICIDGPLIEQVAAFLPHARGKDLVKFSKQTLKHVIRAIGARKDSVESVTRSQMRFLTKLAIKIHEASTSIGLSIIDITGPYVWCGIVASDVSKLPDDVIVKYGDKLLECEQLDFETNKALVNRRTALTNNDGPSVIEEYGEKFMYALESFPAASMTAEMKETLASLAERLMEKLSEAMNKLRRKDNREISATEKDQIIALRKQTASRMFDILIEVKTAASARRKRSAASADCTILSSFPGNLDFLSDTQISSFQTAEVKSCLAQLSTTVWTTAQCTAWRAHLVHADGLGSTVSAWTKTDLQALGTLVDCLTSPEVQSLSVDDEVIQALGTVVLAKSADVMAAYISTTGADLTSMSDETLSDMGNMMCGFSAAQIGDIPQASVHGTAKDLNNLGCMDSTQLTAVGTKIVAVEGSDWSGKDSALVGEFGTFVGGLQQSVLSTFTDDQVKYIAPAALQAIPPATLAGSFSATALAGLSSEQSNAITTEQLNQLSPEQKKNVDENKSITVDTTVLNVIDDDGGGGNGENGASSLRLGAIMTGILLVYIL